jgi:hypothetical protein
MPPLGVETLEVPMTTLNFGSLKVRNTVRRLVVERALELAFGAGTDQVGFGFQLLGYAWNAKRSPVPGKWELFCGDEFFTDFSEAVNEGKRL